MNEVDPWRTLILDTLTATVEPLHVLMLLAAFSLGMFSIRALS